MTGQEEAALFAMSRIAGHVQEMRNIDLWVKTGAIDFDTAKKMAKPHLDAINAKSAEIAKKHGVRARKVYFHNFVH